MNVWVFGDSYVVDHGLEWQWYKQYAKIKNKTAHVMADYGVANSWISMQFFEYLNNEHIKPGDTVIVVTTHCVRHWFLWNHPNVSNYSNMTHLDPDYFGISKDQIRAIEYYYKHIQSGYQDAWLYDANTAWLNTYAQRLQENNVDFFVLQGFSNATDVQPQGTINITNSLFETVCTTEFKNQRTMDEWYERGVPDQRVNHMLKDNHTVLAQALAEGKDFDLADLPWKNNVLSVSTQSMFRDQLSPKLLV